MNYLGDYDANSTVIIAFSTADGNGGRVNPSSAFEAADVRIYKNTSATQRSSSAGITMTSPFDSMTGGHIVAIDTSDDTDAGFYASGNDYTVILYPDETVDGQAVGAVLGQFSLANRRQTTVYPVSSTVAAAVDGSRVTLYQGASSPAFTLVITDADGDAVDCSGMTLRLLARTIDQPYAGLFELSGAEIAVGGASNNEVTCTYDATDTAAAGTYAYELWHSTTRLLVTGPLLIEATRKSLT